MTGSNGDETTRSRTDISTQEEKVYNLLASDFKKGNGLTKYAIRTRTQIPQATALKVLSNLEDECLIIVKREKIRIRTVDICRLSNLGIVRLYRKGLLKQEDVEPLLEDWRGHFKQDMMRLGRKYKGTARGFADTKE